MKVALITGASSGIGEATARLLAKEGYSVALLARSADKLEKIVKDIGPNASAYTCDASDVDAVEDVAARVISQMGVPDVIVNCAGAGRWLKLEETKPDEALEMMRAPYLTAFAVTHVFLPAMLARKSGLIINVNSPASLVPWRSAVGYTAARSALRAFHEALSQDLVGTGVRSSHVIFAKVASSYFENNPGTEEKLPKLGRTMRTYKPEDCAWLIQKVAQQPRYEVMRPRVLRFYHACYKIAPGMVRWALRF